MEGVVSEPRVAGEGAGAPQKLLVHLWQQEVYAGGETGGDRAH